jgi:hypothetical protein
VLQSILSAGFRLHRVNRVRLLRCAEEMGGKINYVDLCQVRERGRESKGERDRASERESKGERERVRERERETERMFPFQRLSIPLMSA